MRKRHELKLLNEFGTHEQLKSYHRDMVVFNRGKTMASTRGTHDQFKIRLWDLGSYKCTNALSGHTNYIRGMTMLN
jgi:WD40 repeat protein